MELVADLAGAKREDLPLDGELEGMERLAERERAEVRVQRVHRVPRRVLGHRGREQLRRDLHVPERVDEQGEPYAVTAEDAAYATFEIDDGPIVQMNSSWCVRVDRDELFELQVDGTHGSAVAGLRECRIQPAAATPRSTWNPDLPDPVAHRAGWLPVPGSEPGNAFRLQWERFLRHVALGDAFPWDFRAGARGAQLAELGLRSWRERRWVEVPAL